MSKFIFLFLIPYCLLFSSGAHAEIYRFFQVSENVFRGSHPEDDADLLSLFTLGVRSIVDLREIDETTAAYDQQVQNLGMRIQHFPISSFDALRGKEPPDDIVNGALAAIAANSVGKVFVHCHAGKDRTGLLVGLYRVFMDNWDTKRAHDEMLQFNFSPLLQKGLETYYWKKTASGNR